MKTLKSYPSSCFKDLPISTVRMRVLAGKGDSGGWRGLVGCGEIFSSCNLNVSRKKKLAPGSC